MNVCRVQRTVADGATHTWLWCIAGDFNLKGVPVDLPHGPGGSAGTIAMFSRTLTNITNSLPYLVGAVLRMLHSHPVECGASVVDGVLHHGLPLPITHAYPVLTFAKTSHQPESYDHVIVSAGVLRGKVLDVFMEPSFRTCFVAFGNHSLREPPTTWPGFVKSFVSDHMPVLAMWAFATA